MTTTTQMDFPEPDIQYYGGPSMATAVVAQAVRLIAQFANIASGFARDADKDVQRLIGQLGEAPDQAGVTLLKAQQGAAATQASLEASLSAVMQQLQADQFTLPPLPDAAMVDFTQQYLSLLAEHFPGLDVAAAWAEAEAATALTSTGITGQTQADQAQARTAFEQDQLQAWAREREILDGAAAQGHRFAPGLAMESIARLRAQTAQRASDALAAANANRLQEEARTKVELALAAADDRASRIQQVSRSVLSSLDKRLKAQGDWASDRLSLVDLMNQPDVLEQGHANQIRAAVLKGVQRVLAANAGPAARADAAQVTAVQRQFANAQEFVDLAETMVAGLLNQVRTSGQFSGSERDVTNRDT